MKLDSICTVILLTFATICAAQSSAVPTPLTDPARVSSALREAIGPPALHELALKLNNSFQLIAQGRDQKGFVRDQAELKEHTANLKAFRKAIKLKLKESNGDASKIARLQNISNLLHYTTEFFFAFEQANDQPHNPNIVLTMDVRESFEAHSKSLIQLTSAIEQTE